MARILVVDDIEDNVFLLQLILERMEHEVVSAYNGKDAIEKARTEHVDLLLLDVMMPGISGLEVAETLKKDPNTHHIPIILLTANKIDVEDIVKGLAAGAEEYLTKPFHETELAARVNSMLRMKQLYDQVASANKSMEEDLHTAIEVQRALLPTHFPYEEKVTFASRYEAARSIGGDYYDVIDLGDGKVGIIMADVSGHGPSGAMIAALAKAMINEITATESSIVKIVSELNIKLLKVTPEPEYLTMFFGSLDTNTGVMTYVRAGHPYPILVKRESGSVENLTAAGDVVGLDDEFFVEEKSVQINKGDRIVTYSDGITEVMDADGNQYGEKRLVDKLKAGLEVDPEALLNEILEEVAGFNSEDSFNDDVAILLVELK